MFSALRGFFDQILGLLGKLPCFDPTNYPEFGTGFWLGNGEFGLVFFIEVVATIVNLMLGF